MSTSKEKRNIGKHACERCRRSKTRCFLDTFDAHGKCRRCFSSNSECTWKEISTTRRRVRTDTRVSELEKQLKNFGTVLTRLRNDTTSEIDDAQNNPSTGHVSHSGTRISTIEGLSINESEPQFDGPAQPLSCSTLGESGLTEPSHLSISHNQLAQSDSLTALLVGEGLSKNRLAELAQDFNALLLPQYPIIAPISKETFESFSTLKPLLTAAIVTAASSVSEPGLFERLHTKLTRILGEQVVVQGDKSIELVQAVLICGVWYHPPTKIENLTFQLCNIAATMSLELGLGGRSSWHANHRVVAGFQNDASSMTMEAFRTMFSVYLTCSRVAISLRRQRMISFSPGTDIALETFAEHAKSTGDKRLVAWVRLQLIAEDVEKMKTNIESRGEYVFTNREAVKHDISLCSDRLNDWEAAASESILSAETLRIDLCFCKGKLHELAIYADYNIEDLAVPFLSPARPVLDRTTGTNDLNPTYVRALLSFINDCHAILDTVLATDVIKLRCCPILTHLRIPYAFKALGMVQKALESPSNSNISKVVDDETLRSKYYVVALSEHMEAASDHGVYSAPSAALKIRDVAMNIRSTAKNNAENEVQSKGLSPIQGGQNDRPQVLQTGESTEMPINMEFFDLNDSSMSHQPQQSSLLSFDDLDLLNFDFGPGIMDWSV